MRTKPNFDAGCLRPFPTKDLASLPEKGPDKEEQMRKKLTLLLAVAAIVVAPPGAHAAAQCAEASAGGDWPLYGHDLQNSRTQLDTTIDAATAPNLAPAWVFNVTSQKGSGAINSTPTIADGCVFVATDQGDVYALNAETGALVWEQHYTVAETRLGGVITGAVAISHGYAFVTISDAGHPFLAALGEFDGIERWRAVVDDRYGSFIDASPVPYDDLVFVGFAGDEYGAEARGGYAIVGIEEQAVVYKQYTIPDNEFQAGYFGGSVWSTGVVDENGHLYVGAGNPASHSKEAPYTDAVLKIDLNEGPTFGHILDAYKGNTDQYYPGLDRQPACQNAPDITYGDAWSITCVQFDLDFGASPTLFKDALGHTMVGAQQKAGIFHGIYAEGMEQAWTSIVGTPCFICNAASPAVSNGTIVTVGTMPGQVIAMNQNTGGYTWASPLADLVHYNSVTIGKGVAFAPDFYGNLNGFDLGTGAPILKRNMALDVGTTVNGTSSAGVALARNKLYAPAAGFLIAYRTP